MPAAFLCGNLARYNMVERCFNGMPLKAGEQAAACSSAEAGHDDIQKACISR